MHFPLRRWPSLRDWFLVAIVAGASATRTGSDASVTVVSLAAAVALLALARSLVRRGTS